MGGYAITAGMRWVGLALLATIAQPALADQPRQPMAEAFAELASAVYDAAPEVTHLHLVPFKAERGGPGDCDTELRNGLADAMAKRQADIVTDRRIALRQGLGLDSAMPGHVRVQGTYGVSAGQVWAEASVLGADGAVAASLPRRLLLGLVCRGESQSLVQAAEARAGIKPDAALAISMRINARIGDAVTFDIKSDLPETTLPLCLNLAADNTAQVLTPLRAASPAVKPRGILTWPSDFGGAGIPPGPFCYDREQNDALVCFAMRNAPNPELERLWRAAWPDGTAEPRDLPTDEALDLVSAATGTHAAAAAQRYRVGPRVAGVPSACRGTRR